MTVDDKLVRLIWLQAGLQKNTYSFDFTKMTQDERIQYIRDQHQAAIVELTEALDEVAWKPWTTGPRWVHRDNFVNELVDVLHFWLNMVLVVSSDMSPREVADEIFTRFALKNRTNTQRQVDGYDGRSTKCGGCGRALDDFAVECWRLGDQGHCAKTDSDINYIVVIDAAEREVVSPKTKICLRCGLEINDNGCVPATTERWGHCGVDQRNLPPIKLPTT